MKCEELTENFHRKELDGSDAEIEVAALDLQLCILKVLALWEELHVFLEPRHRAGDGGQHVEECLKSARECATCL